ncbi:FAD-binding protein [Halogeometricum borinquense]|uniref:FAD-binding protein n=1 Tax=Halogeometricum borinquense TaxID=60847 RepID=A0A6C0UP74_9EURY|nr:FAD-dependent monooxygenase [Halogeometricum borinquense]QIB74748.1 FAD-binding protein [Halogeometricum borinquense]QIQ76297.1 FAD-binding protein [Halogeometricum borinquense]
MSRVGTEEARTFQTDVVIVGAGPAGCVLGGLLARSGVETMLLERHATFDREFRGFAFQPSALRIFDQMAVLERVLDLPHERISRFKLELYGRLYTFVDFTTLSPPHDFVLSIDQPPLLRLLVDDAERFETFEFRPSTVVRDLLVEDGSVVGVRATDREMDEELTIRSRLVVGADGRYSTVRQAADIDPGLVDTDFEVVWTKVPGSASHEIQVRINEDGQLLYFGLGSDVQLGWLIEKGTYPDLREQGIEAFRDQIAAVDPRLRPALAESLTSFDQCSLLDVSPGFTDEWVRDGLALIGDAAHVASPLGGQGNALAIQDAAVLHAAVVPALRRESGVLSASSLEPYAARRRPAVRRILDMQLLGQRAISMLVTRGDDIPAVIRQTIAKAGATAATVGPVSRRLRDLIAFGPDPVDVETALFDLESATEDPPPSPNQQS